MGKKNKKNVNLISLCLLFVLLSCSSIVKTNNEKYDNCFVISQFGNVILDQKQEEVIKFLKSKKSYSFLLVTRKNSYSGTIRKYSLGFVNNDSLYIYDKGDYNFIRVVESDLGKKSFPKENTMSNFACKENLGTSVSYEYLVKHKNVIASLVTSLRFQDIPEKQKKKLISFNLFDKIKLSDN